ncbi:solute carrier family 23 member 1-like [Mizuhopecten yessoensis]|uniref:Solute carrier family 23 member 2 n=1 Tax=Mizuhopecten yessoensis TaxID=6573 RepID=A0A210QMF5_MIZYE|nr:solute carrier family 23 member 1-like [Mizuhopecten yessoensis]OWF49908.1 Solute carrier family 23 member 2 [Mizuhopecten yessoensis]
MAELTEFTKSSCGIDDHNRDECNIHLSDPSNNVGDVFATGPMISNGVSTSKKSGKARYVGLEYGVDDLPALHMCFIFGLQQVLLAISSTISIPLIVSDKICAGDLQVVKSEIMSTFLFMCGICTILQVVVGVRLPIIQGGCHKFIPAITALLALEKWKCPDFDTSAADVYGVMNATLNETVLDRTEIWQSRIREIQGGIMLASVTQVFIGCTGLLGILLRYIGPITIVPTITLVGLSLIDVAIRYCEKQWGISGLTIGLVFIFSLYLRNIVVPTPSWSRRKGCHVIKFPYFKLLPVLLAVGLSWSLCGILTETEVFSSNSSLPEYWARTDARTHVLYSTEWLFFPYPCQWGLPTVSIASFMAMLAATVTSIIESVGDYYACARVSGAAPPPAHAVNRGIAIEGFGSILSGLVGSGGATTSYSQNIGAIGFTKVASRGVFVAAGIIFLLSGVFGKFGAILVMLPDPVLGGIVVISFGMVTSVGLSNLQFVDLSSGRNLCIIGSSLIIGLMVPKYLNDNPGVINTGINELDQALVVLLSTAMFVGGMLAFILDNTVSGTDEERGILLWRCQISSTSVDRKDVTEESTVNPLALYDLPLITPLLHRIKWCRFVPFMSTFEYDSLSKDTCCTDSDGTIDQQHTLKSNENNSNDS